MALIPSVEKGLDLEQAIKKYPNIGVQGYNNYIEIIEYDSPDHILPSLKTIKCHKYEDLDINGNVIYYPLITHLSLSDWTPDKLNQSVVLTDKLNQSVVLIKFINNEVITSGGCGDDYILEIMEIARNGLEIFQAFKGTDPDLIDSLNVDIYDWRRESKRGFDRFIPQVLQALNDELAE